VRPDLQIDLDDVSSKLDRGVRALLIVHYFGFPQDLPPLRKLCDEAGIALVEDCAHSFFGCFEGGPPGSMGDFAIASAMKFFPICDGGILVSKRHAIDGVQLRSAGSGFQLKSLLNACERSFGYSRLRPLNWLMVPPLYLKDRLWALAKKRQLVRRDLAPGSSAGSYSFDPAWVDVRMSAASTWLLGKTSLGRIVSRRRDNYRRLAESFRGLSQCAPLFPELPEDVVPYVFPLVVHEPSETFRRVKTQGVPLFRWDELGPTECETSARYSETLFQIPCHQELSGKDLSWMISEIRKAFRRP
jgi:dTDP-4-amino-4,6-dideoxygalactose transaminase